MAVVYLAEHEKLGNQVAIKVLSDVLTSNTSVRERFIQEARMMVSLRHSGIVTVTDFIETDKSLAIVMDYIEGRSLDEMIGNEVGPIPYEKALPIFEKILEAVAYAHSKGIVHRDLKPANILVGNDGEVKVADFGIAKITGQQGLTKTGVQMGTLYYESPEQIMGASNVDQRSDVYSLGMTLFEMLAGRLPFDDERGTSEYKIMDSIVKREHDLDPRVFYPHVPAWLVSVVQKATALSMEDRYSDCDSMLRDLNAHGDSEVLTDVRKGSDVTKIQESASAGSRAAVDSFKYEEESKVKKPIAWIIPVIAVAAVVIVVLVSSLGGGDAGQVSQSVPGQNQSQAIPEDSGERIYPEPEIVSVQAFDECPPSSNGNYYASNVLDGDWSTAWNADWEGAGTDAWFRVYLEEESMVGEISLIPGYAKVHPDYGDVFQRNYRIKDVIVSFPSGRNLSFQFQDQRRMQDISVSPPELCSMFTIHINSVYESGGWQDIAISELTVDGE